MEIYSSFSLNPANVNDNTTLSPIELFQTELKPFMYKMISPDFEEGVALFRQTKDTLIDYKSRVEFQDTESLYVYHPDDAMFKQFHNKLYVMSKDQIQIVYRGLDRPIHYAYKVLKHAFRNVGSNLMFTKNDCINYYNEKAVGAISHRIGNRSFEIIMINFGVSENDYLYIPEDEWHRPLGNIDVDINILIDEFLKLLLDNMQVD